MEIEDLIQIRTKTTQTEDLIHIKGKIVNKTPTRRTREEAKGKMQLL